MPGIGVAIDTHIEKLFRIAIDRYLLTDKKYSFPYVHGKFKSLYETYYPETPESEIPTNWQMLHFFKREYSQMEKIQKRRRFSRWLGRSTVAITCRFVKTSSSTCFGLVIPIWAPALATRL